MKITINNIQKEILLQSTDFNILCILQQSLINNILTLSKMHVEMLYDFCCDSHNIELIKLANNILKKDKNIIKPFILNLI